MHNSYHLLLKNTLIVSYEINFALLFYKQIPSLHLFVVSLSYWISANTWHGIPRRTKQRHKKCSFVLHCPYHLLILALKQECSTASILCAPNKISSLTPIVDRFKTIKLIQNPVHVSLFYPGFLNVRLEKSNIFCFSQILFQYVHLQIPIYFSIIISFLPDFVYPSIKKTLMKTNPSRSNSFKICDCLSYLYYIGNRRKS